MHNPKLAFSLPVLITCLLSSCSTTTQKAPPPVTASVSDITVLSAEFGRGTHVADVTARVTELLRALPRGFEVNGSTLGADPTPGKKKVLTIRYTYKGVVHTLSVPGKRRMSYQSLVTNDAS